MPGIHVSIFDPRDPTPGRDFEVGLNLVVEHTDLMVERHSEPGLRVCCIYHTEVCTGPRLVVTRDHVLAYYGNVYRTEATDGTDTIRHANDLLQDFVAGGIDALQHLNGRYDIALFDRRSRVFHFVSDRFGAHRHYMRHAPGALHLACEVKALAPHLKTITLDPAGLASMLTFGYHIGDLTTLSDIACLPNACQLEFDLDCDRLQIRRYWDYPFGEAEPQSGSEGELAEALYHRLAAALQRQLRGVRAVLLPLSGGLDSRTMAGLLARSGFTGNVLAYSYGQASSRDVRYGREIARRLGYRHVTIPTPTDFIVHDIEEDAWRFDAEWSAEVHWATRFAYRDPCLGDTTGYCVLSGMFGDIMLGSESYHRRSLDDKILNANELAQAYFLINQEYGPFDEIFDMFDRSYSLNARMRLTDTAEKLFASKTRIRPYYAMIRAEFEQRQRRYTAQVAQAIERDHRVLTPFLDNDVVDYATCIPYQHFRAKKVYRRMIIDHLPDVASIRQDRSGLPLSPTPLREAIHWRGERLKGKFPQMKKWLDRRHALFDFRGGVYAARAYFYSKRDALLELSPVLDKEKAVSRYTAMIEGRLGSQDQVCALLPQALFMQLMRRRHTTVSAAL